MQKKENSFKTLIKILNVIKGKKRYLVVLLLLQSVFAITTVGYAFFLRNIIDCAVSANLKGVYLNVFELAGLAVFQFILRLFVKFFDEFSRSNLENVIKKRLFGNILIRDFSAVSAMHTGEWLNRLTGDTVIIADSLVSIFPGICATLIKIITAAVFLFILIPKFAFFVVIGGLFLILFTWFIRKILKKLHLNVQLADDKLKVFLTEHITALAMVKAYNREETSLSLSNDLMLNHKKARMKKCNFSNIAISTFSLLINTVQVLAALYCGTSIITGYISFGTFTAVMQLISLIQAPISSVSGYLPRFYAMLASAERIFEIEKFNKDNYENEFDLIEFYNNNFIELGFEDVDFSYATQNGENKVFNNFNLKINKGDFVAFVGDSGCGKSTTLKLLLSLYNINKGSIYVKGNNKTYQLNSRYRDLFAYVPQGNMLMNGTIAQVISFNNTSFDLEKLNKALEISCSTEFVNELPLGVNTPLGERGTGLSEGQMQRIAIARAIYSEKPILLLDEATSALDAATEEKLLNNLKNMTNKTVVIVTHRAGVLSAVNKTVNFVLKEDVNNDK